MDINKQKKLEKIEFTSEKDLISEKAIKLKKINDAKYELRKQSDIGTARSDFTNKLFLNIDRREQYIIEITNLNEQIRRAPFSGADRQFFNECCRKRNICVRHIQAYDDKIAKTKSEIKYALSDSLYRAYAKARNANGSRLKDLSLASSQKEDRDFFRVKDKYEGELDEHDINLSVRAYSAKSPQIVQTKEDLQHLNHENIMDLAAQVEESYKSHFFASGYFKDVRNTLKNYKDKPDNANLIVALRSVNKYLGSHDGARKTQKGRERLYLMETVQRGLLSALRNNTKPDSYPDPEAGQYCSDTERDLADYTAREDISPQYKEVQSKLVEYRNKTCSFDDVIAAAEKCSAAHKSSQNRDKYFYSDTIDELIAHKDQIKALRGAALKEKGISAEFDKIYRISPNGELTVNEDELKKINMTLSKTQIDGKNTAERLNVFKLLSMLPDSDNVLKADIADAERKFALMVKTHTRTINEGEIYMNLDAIDHKIDDCVTAHSLKDADKSAIEHDIAIYRMLKKYYLKSFEYKQKKS
jgi:hypothetical protein